MYNLVVLAIFKNESHIINEWITHHLNQGVEHFYMIDNGSNDNYRDEIPVGAPVTIVVDPTRNDQNGCYNRNFKDICTIKEGIDLLKLISKIKKKNEN